MRIRALIDEDFVQYKTPSMFIGTCFCDWKCCRDGKFPESVCQNNTLATAPIINIESDKLIKRYLNNDLTHAIVFGGLEPFNQINELMQFLCMLRNAYNCDDMVVIYTGYNEDEARDVVDALKGYKNIIVKFGRYIPGEKAHLDPVLGVKLASNNQYAKQIS